MRFPKCLRRFRAALDMQHMGVKIFISDGDSFFPQQLFQRQHRPRDQLEVVNRTTLPTSPGSSFSA